MFEITADEKRWFVDKGSRRMTMVKRPPFDFGISGEFTELINELVDTIEEGDIVTQALLEQEIWAARRELPEGSAEEDWILSYYYERGWKLEQ
jgi:hypothetical protein